KPVLPVPITIPRWLALASPQHAIKRLAGRAIEAPQLPVQHPVHVISVPSQPALAREAPSLPVIEATRPTLSVAAGLMVAWASVSSLLLLRLGRTQWRMHRLLLRAEPIDQAALSVDLERLRQAIGVRRTIPLLASPAVASPAVWGLVRPSLIVPTEP